ncbi:stage 0 sporulation family protein [Desulfocurvus sp.]|uniref:PSP1 domain-containing protein n=1 Tax=Desulfocurvus sp. TaxID=2871698 RepID=UPI0025C1FD7D|nr:stage 0 sporulation family protein [Desulfocurvus sp.]MCK9240687.1 stage 0 sporulation family protein [Desulfocurvus sp.]
MSHVLGLKFSDYGQIYYFDSGPFVVARNDRVIVKTDQGMGLGTVVTLGEVPPEDVPADGLKPIFRLATEEDLATEAENAALAREAYRFCRQCVAERELEMKLVDVEVFFDHSKMVFYFTAPGRIDFRELVKDLVRNYRTRIELRQIGVRHETQMLGAVGNCGQVACCRRFMRKFAPVTIKMAKEQNLFLNPTKISGICGRLLCCLSFEEENYREFYRQCPKIGKRMDTDQGLMKVLRANFFRGGITVFTEVGEERELTLEEWHALNPRRYDPQVPRPEPQPAPAPPRRGGRPGPRGAGGAPGGPASRGPRPGGEPSEPAAEAAAPRPQAPEGPGAPQPEAAPAAPAGAGDGAGGQEAAPRRAPRPGGPGRREPRPEGAAPAEARPAGNKSSRRRRRRKPRPDGGSND